MPEVPSKTCVSIRGFRWEEPCRSYLNNGTVSCVMSTPIFNWLSRFLTSSFENLPRPFRAIGQRESHNLVVLWEFDLAHGVSCRAFI